MSSDKFKRKRQSMKLNIHDKCEECGANLADDRCYIQAPGGQMLDVCGKCAEMFAEEDVCL